MLVDVKYEVPDDVVKDWDIEPMMRLPKVGDTYLGYLGLPVACNGDHTKSDGEKIILRKKWKWPEWLTAAAIAMDADGKWYAYTKLPNIAGEAWDYNDVSILNLADFVSSEFIPVARKEDWKKSLIINPSRRS